MNLAVFKAQACFRLIPTRSPSVDIFQGIADFGEWEAISEIENLWNARNTPYGPLSSIPRERRAYGPGSSYIMAPFAYPSASRFSDGSYGALYAAFEEATAVDEVAFHRAEFMRRFNRPKELTRHLLLSLDLNGSLKDIRGQRTAHPELYSADTAAYGPAQSFGSRLHAKGVDGVVYHSVRHLGGTCAAGFWPNLFSNCRQVCLRDFFWDGKALRT